MNIYDISMYWLAVKFKACFIKICFILSSCKTALFISWVT